MLEHNFRNVTLCLMRRNYFRPIHPAFVKDVYGLERVRYMINFLAFLPRIPRNRRNCQYAVFSTVYISFQERSLAQAFECTINLVILLLITLENERNNNIILSNDSYLRKIILLAIINYNIFRNKFILTTVINLMEI